MPELVKKRRLSFGACCGAGCFGVLVVTSVVFGYFLSTTARYQPVLPPAPPLPVPNGFDDYVAAGRMLRANGGTKAMYAQQGSGPIVRAQAASVLAKNRAALTRLRQAFPKECRVPIEGSMAELFPYLADTRDMARLLAGEAAVRTHRGDIGGAFDSGLDTIEMGQDLMRGGPLIHGLVGVACQAIAHTHMVDRIERLSATDCDRVAARLQRLLETQPTGADVLTEERRFLLSSMLKLDQAILSGSRKALEEQLGPPDATDGYGMPIPVSPASLPGRMFWRYNRDAAFREMETHFDHLLRDARVPAAQRTPLPEPKNILANLFMPVFEQAISRFDQTDIHNRLMLIALKVRAYRLRHGRLPASLSDLNLPAALTMDPCSGKPLVYRPMGSDYLLYSVGPDLKDDGGVPADEGTALPYSGDLGLRPFRYQNQSNTSTSRYYRRVPHMKPPKLPPGAPPLHP